MAKGELHTAFSAGIYNGLLKLSVPLFGMISTMILAHKALTKTEMGAWTLFLIVTSFVELIRQALVKTSMIRYMNHSNIGDHVFVKSAALFMNIVITVILAVGLDLTAGYVGGLLEAPELQYMIYFFTVGLLMLIPFSHFEWIMYSMSMFRALFWMYFIRNAITLVLIILAVAFHGKVSLNELVIYFSAGILCGLAIGFWLVRLHLKDKFVLSREWIGRMWGFGRYIFGSGLSTLVFSNASQVMLSPILGSTSFTASQNISARVVNLADMPSQVLSDMLFPKTSKRENSESASIVKYYYEKTVGATLCFTLPMVLVVLLFPKLIILLIAGPQYLDAVLYLQVIAVSAIFLAFLKHYAVILDSTGNPHINFTTITIIAIAQVVLAYFGISQFGFMGAAYAQVASHIFGFILTQTILVRKFDISFMACFRQAWFLYPVMFQILREKLLWKKS